MKIGHLVAGVAAVAACAATGGLAAAPLAIGGTAPKVVKKIAVKGCKMAAGKVVKSAVKDVIDSI